MKAKSVIILLCCVVCLGASAQTVKEKKTVGNFSKISSSAGIDVYYTQGGSYSVEIETDAENMPKIDINVNSENLTLKCKDGERFKKNSKIKAYVSAPALNGISFSGGADFSAQSINNDKEFSISASGGADIDINKIKARDIKISLSGGADCDMKNVEVAGLSLSISGGSDADIHILNADVVNVSASGGADVALSGKAKMVNVSCSGGADVDVKNLSREKIESHKSGGGGISL